MGYISYTDILWLYVPLIFVVDQTDSSECPPNGKVYSTTNYCYWVNTDAFQFNGADDECKTHGGRLARIPDFDAKQFIEDNFSSDLSVSNGWIGVKTDDYSTFISVEGDPVTYLPWLTVYTANGQCLILDTAVSPYKYKEDQCNSYHLSVCYINMGQITTESTTITTTKEEQTTEQSTIPETTTPMLITVVETTTSTTNAVTTTQFHTATEETTISTRDGVTTTSSTITGETTIAISEPSTKGTCVCECSSPTNLNTEDTMSLLSNNLHRLINMFSSSIDSISDILTCANTTSCKMSSDDFRSCTIMVI